MHGALIDIAICAAYVHVAHITLHCRQAERLKTEICLFIVSFASLIEQKLKALWVVKLGQRPHANSALFRARDQISGVVPP